MAMKPLPCVYVLQSDQSAFLECVPWTACFLLASMHYPVALTIITSWEASDRLLLAPSAVCYLMRVQTEFGGNVHELDSASTGHLEEGRGEQDREIDTVSFDNLHNFSSQARFQHE
jgi:hypothetical protein